MEKPIDGYEGKYLIDDKGQVRTVRRQGSGGGYLSQRKNSNGYYRVDLRKGKEKKSMLVHRLVANAFLPEKPGKDCINHIDGNKENNTLNNLERCTRSENMKHAIATGLNHVPGLKGEKHPMHKLMHKDVEKIKELYKIGTTSTELSKQFNVTKEQIYNIINNKQWRCEICAKKNR